MMKRKLLTALGLAALIATPVFAAGLWPTLPTVGGASFCGGTSTGVSGQICTTTVPAGPTTLTGNELVPADTAQTQGSPPQTVRIPVPSLASGAYQYIVPTTGNTYTVPNGVTNFVMNPAGTLAALSITMPSAPYDGQVLHVSSSQTITGFGVIPAGTQTVSNKPTALTISTTVPYGYAWMYKASNTTWFRLQ